jgi:hypothetical protein
MSEFTEPAMVSSCARRCLLFRRKNLDSRLVSAFRRVLHDRKPAQCPSRLYLPNP